MKENKLESMLSLKGLWDTHSHNIWLGTNLNLIRNLSKFKFPSKLDKFHQDRIISLIYEGLETCPDLQNPSLFHAADMKPMEKEFLTEHFFIIDNFHQAHGGEGFVLDESGTFLGVINVDNHLQLMIIDNQQEMEKTWHHLVKIEDWLGKKFSFAYNSRFGFLTTQPAFSGTGLVVTLFLHLPAVMHSGEFPELLEKEEEEEVIISSLQGSRKEMIGDIVVSKNSCTLGLADEYILTSLRMWATKAIVSEIHQRKKIKESGNEQIKNKVTRALGLLTHSYQIEVVEALNALSLVKLGAEMGWVRVPKEVNLTQLFLNCRRAHLMQVYEGQLEVADLNLKRAEYLHKIANTFSLNF